MRKNPFLNEIAYTLLLNLSVAVFLIMSPFSRIWAKLGLILIWLCYCVYLIGPNSNGRHIKLSLSSPLNKGFLLFGISAIISTVFSVSPYLSQKIIFNRYLLYLLCFYAGFNFIKNKRDVKFLVIVFLISGIILGLGGLSYYLRNFPERLFFSWNINVDIALFAILFLPFSFIFLLKEENSGLITLTFLGFSLMTICFILNYSRGAFLSVVLGICITLFISKKYKDLFFLLAFALILLLIAAILKTDRLFDLHTWEYRRSYINEGLKLFKSSLLVGKGLGSFELINFVHPAVGRHAIHVENLVVEILAQSGIFGLFSFVYLFFLYIKQFIKRVEELETYELALISSIIACLIIGFFGSVILVGVTMSFLFWFLVGISISRLRLNADNLG